MAPSKSNRNSNTKLTAQRRKTIPLKSSAAKSSTPQGKENASPNGVTISPPPKTNDSHEQNWWTIHVEKAVTLIERCMKVYAWNRIETKTIFNSYRLFLLLKKEHGDWEATYLHPCWPIDRMWLQHTQMCDYDYDMTNLLGHVVHRSKLLTTQRRDDATRKKTMQCLRRTFGNSALEEELWNHVEVRIVDQLGEETILAMNRREPLSTFFKEYAESKEEESVDKFQFAFDGKIINDTDDGGEATPMRLGMNGCNNEIKASHIDKVAITMRYFSESKERGFLIDNTSMMSSTLDEFAQEILETERAKLVFIFKETRIYGYESPLVFNMKRCDNIINVVDLESYKCKNCICCCPNQNVQKDTSKDLGVQEDSSDDVSVAKEITVL